MSDETRGDREAWLEGYEWALSHLTDPGVLADARRLALAYESAEAAREAPARTVEPHGTYHGGPTPPVAPPPQSVPREALARQIVGAIADPGAVVGRRLHPSWGAGNAGYRAEPETIAEWGARAVLKLLPCRCGNDPLSPGRMP